MNLLQVGTGEYTTGFVGGGPSGSDKKVGVVGLNMFDLRRRGKVGKLSMVGVSGSKFPAISELFLFPATLSLPSSFASLFIPRGGEDERLVWTDVECFGYWKKDNICSRIFR